MRGFFSTSISLQRYNSLLRYRWFMPVFLARVRRILLFWEYAKKHNLVIVSKDADFSERAIISAPPPRVIHLKFGNMRKKDFHEFLAKVWPRIELLITTHKLVNVYRTRIETTS